MFKQEMTIQKVQNAYRWVLISLGAVAMTAVVLMSFSTTLDVIKRWSTGWPFGGIMQLNECLMVVLVFLGIPYSQYERRHIRIAFIVSRFSPSTIVKFDIISSFLGLVCLLMLGIMTTKEAIYSFSILEYRVGDVRLPIYWARALIPLGCFAFAGQLLISIWKGVEKMRGHLPKTVLDIRSLKDGL